MMSCYLCCPPKTIRCDGFSEEIHVKMFHLGPYTPFKCPKCEDRQFSLERSFVTHAMLKHKTYTLTPLVKPSSYLDVLSNVMMQTNSYVSNNLQESSVELVKRIQSESVIKIDEPQIPIDENTEQSELICEFCEMKFARLFMYRKHQDNRHNHESTGAHRCQSCTKRYHYPSNLRVHETIHKNHRDHTTSNLRKLEGKNADCRRPTSPTMSLSSSKKLGVKCKGCSLIFPNRSDLIQHQIKFEHGGKPRSSASVHLYYCLECDRSFCAKPQQHVAMFHVKKQVVACTKCNHTNTWSTANMRKHIEAVHHGKASIIDQRVSIATELLRLEKKLIVPNAL